MSCERFHRTACRGDTEGGTCSLGQADEIEISKGCSETRQEEKKTRPLGEAERGVNV
jgi:hypothetical protein